QLKTGLKFLHNGLAGRLAHFGRSLARRQTDGETRAFARCALDPDFSFVCFDDPGDETQPESKSLIRSWRRTRAGYPVEPVEDMGQILLRNSTAGILDRKLDPPWQRL